MTGMSRSRCALQERNERNEMGGGLKMRVLLTPLREGDSRNPACGVSGRHIADLKDQLGRPSRRVRPGWCLSTKTV